MAQQVEHVLGKDEVTGSNPVSSSTAAAVRNSPTLVRSEGGDFFTLPAGEGAGFSCLLQILRVVVTFIIVRLIYKHKTRLSETTDGLNLY